MITRHQRDLGLWACAQWRALPDEAWLFGRWFHEDWCETVGCALGWTAQWLTGGQPGSYRKFALTRFGVEWDDFVQFFSLQGWPNARPTAQQVADRFEDWIRRQEVSDDPR